MKFSAQGFSFDWRKRVAFLCPPQWTISQAPKEAARVQIHAHSMGSLSYEDGRLKRSRVTVRNLSFGSENKVWLVCLVKFFYPKFQRKIFYEIHITISDRCFWRKIFNLNIFEPPQLSKKKLDLVIKLFSSFLFVLCLIKIKNKW